ncbi:hypothetical protein N9940_01375 [bacterium]|nr:hypothetical protein [bacterium]MDB4296224.1 hypothetical protein [bacterium]MDB4320046.1 hypothetical protein [bacterium]MDC0288943.1 hypothetical protein [Akkermansiaceae bacterium]
MSHHPTGILEKSLSFLVAASLLWLLSPILQRGGGRLVILLIIPLFMIWAPSMPSEFIFKSHNENAVRHWGWIILLLLTVSPIIAVYFAT